MGGRVFLTAEWRDLVMLNYEVAPEILEPWLPAGLELDQWEGRTLMSVVSFQFLRTRLLGCAIPFHQNFPEVNLRFYVRRKCGDTWRRGVVFVREIVPRRAIAAVARLLYGERYVRCPMRHSVRSAAGGQTVAEYEWYVGQRWQGISASFEGTAQPMIPGSEEEFIFEHYWGYARQSDRETVEYEVRHPRWNVWHVQGARLTCDPELFGTSFASALQQEPVSAFIADGSEVEVLWGSRCPLQPTASSN